MIEIAKLSSMKTMLETSETILGTLMRRSCQRKSWNQKTVASLEVYLRLRFQKFSFG